MALVLTVSPVLADDVAEDEPTLLIVGDSLSAAYRMPVAASWPMLLEQRLRDNGTPHRVVNASISGETTGGGLRRLPTLLARHDPEWVIIELGGNDGLRGLPVQSTRANIERMIIAAQESGARVLLAGMKLPPNYGPAFTRPFEEMYPQLAEAHGTLLLPFILNGVALQPGMMMADGIHPTAEAQPVILDNLWQVLAPQLESAEATPSP